jgi:hypothetical protein
VSPARAAAAAVIATAAVVAAAVAVIVAGWERGADWWGRGGGGLQLGVAGDQPQQDIHAVGVEQRVDQLRQAEGQCRVARRRARARLWPTLRAVSWWVAGPLEELRVKRKLHDNPRSLRRLACTKGSQRAGVGQELGFTSAGRLAPLAQRLRAAAVAAAVASPLL